MAITVGLDFGTHQTKVCIENSDDPNRKTYEFMDWGSHNYVLPSTIQINKDRTLCYGSIDMGNVLVGKKKKYRENPGTLILPNEPTMPVLVEIEEPVMPPMPIYEYITERGLKFTFPMTDLYGIGKPLPKREDSKNQVKAWKKKCKKINQEYQKRLTKWKQIGPSFGLPKPQRPVLPPIPEFSDQQNEGIDDINPNMIATKEQIAEYNRWKVKCDLLRSSHKKAIARNNDELKRYNHKHQLWVDECRRLQSVHDIRVKQYQESLVEYPMVFRYFKQATFSSYNWDYQIEAKDLSVLYLAYIIFKLKERFGKNFAIQMGIPASENTFRKLNSFASGLLIQAIRLVEEVFENNFDRFISTPYDELIELIPTFEYSDSLKYDYGIMILPEAYASLRSITSNGRIPRGMSLMLDIGGGTSDISFFVIEENGEPHVYHFESIPKGLNYFLEYGENKIADFSVKKEVKDLTPAIFSKAYKDYKTLIDRIVKSLTNFLHDDTISRGFSKHSFTYAIQNRPVIYTGGGCSDIRMRKPVLDFTDVIHLDKSILRIPNVIKEQFVNIPYSIMATSFGLSISLMSDDIQVSKKEELFANYTKEENNRWDAYQEHGMYED